MIRRIGIDFGTSTTVVRVKNYEDDGKSPVGSNALACDAVKFSGMDTVPSLVREWTGASGDRVCVYGAKAANDRPGSTLWTGFKMDLESPDSGKAAKAWALTDAFFCYLYAAYNEENLNGSFGDGADREETWVAHPVKWKQATVRRLAESVEKAGFQNVRPMNEAQAAVTSVALRNTKQLEQELGVSQGDAYRFLLVDMGAGTTDLVLGDYTYAARASGTDFRAEVCWPNGDGGFTCGGREFDRRLAGWLEKVLEENGLDSSVMADNTGMVKRWKETLLSPELRENRTVSEFDLFNWYRQNMGFQLPFTLDRETVQEIFRKELAELIGLVNGCMARTGTPSVDAVILVGGGSQWYFVKDLILGRLEVDGKSVRLSGKDGAHPAVLSVSRPQETVAQGLVLEGLALPEAPARDVPKPVGTFALPDNIEEYNSRIAQGFTQRILNRYFKYATGKDSGGAPQANKSDKRAEQDKTDLERKEILDSTRLEAELYKLVAQAVEQLTRQERVKIDFFFCWDSHSCCVLTGSMTRALCNRLTGDLSLPPLFPAAGLPPEEEKTISVYGYYDQNIDAAIDTVRRRETPYLLTGEQKDRLRCALQDMNRPMAGRLTVSQVVQDGYKSMPRTAAGIYSRMSQYFGISHTDFEVYSCHPVSANKLKSGAIITELGLIVRDSGWAHFHSWYRLCLENPHLESYLPDDCKQPLIELLRAFLRQLRKEFEIETAGRAAGSPAPKSMIGKLTVAIAETLAGSAGSRPRKFFWYEDDDDA